MMDNWTIKGPWKVVKHSWQESSVYGPDNKSICTIRIDYEVTEETEAHYEQVTAAKARAIAALPDLVEALEAFMESYKVDREIQEPTHVRDCWVLARSALLKAKGEGK